MPATPPLLSVVLVTDNFGTIRDVVECMRRQTIHDGLELVIATPSRAQLGATDADLAGFAAVQVVEVGSVDRFDVPRAAAIKAAAAPYVFIGETHTLAHPGFAQGLLDAHAAGWPVVIPGFGNANPETVLSWAIFLLDYGRSSHRLPATEVNYTPTHNASFAKEALLALEPALAPSLSQGEALGAVFRARGHRSFRASSARIEHVNVSRLSPWIRERAIHGLLVAQHRNRRWSLGRRLVYFAGSPLIPAVLLYRLRRCIWLARLDGCPLLQTVPVMIAGAMIAATMEGLGYLIGTVGDAQRWMMPYEMHKMRYISAPARLPVAAEPANRP